MENVNPAPVPEKEQPVQTEQPVSQQPKMLNIADLESSSVTSCTLKHPTTGKPVGVVISGYTPDSSEWRSYQRKQNDPNRKTNLYIEKGGRQSVELDADAADKRRELLAAVVTDITGLNNWTFSTDNVADLFENPKLAWMVEQWGDWLDDRKNFF